MRIDTITIRLEGQDDQLDKMDFLASFLAGVLEQWEERYGEGLIITFELSQWDGIAREEKTP